MIFDPLDLVRLGVRASRPFVAGRPVEELAGEHSRAVVRAGKARLLAALPELGVVVHPSHTLPSVLGGTAAGVA